MVEITGEPEQQESRSPFTRVTCGTIPPAPFGFVYRAGRPCPHFSSGFGTDTPRPQRARGRRSGDECVRLRDRNIPSHTDNPYQRDDLDEDWRSREYRAELQARAGSRSAAGFQVCRMRAGTRVLLARRCRLGVKSAADRVLADIGDDPHPNMEGFRSSLMVDAVGRNTYRPPPMPSSPAQVRHIFSLAYRAARARPERHITFTVAHFIGIVTRVASVIFRTVRRCGRQVEVPVGNTCHVAICQATRRGLP